MQVCDQIDQILKDQWAVMGQYDVDHNVHLVVDEYGPSYREGTEVDPTHIFGQQVSIRDALATALTLDTFNRNSDKVTLATNAQLVNTSTRFFSRMRTTSLPHRTTTSSTCTKAIRMARA